MEKMGGRLKRRQGCRETELESEKLEMGKEVCLCVCLSVCV